MTLATLANCKDCGGLYLKTRSCYCPDCQKEHDHLYTRVRTYLRANPRSTVADVHEQTGIPMSKLLQMGKEDYIPFSR